MRNKEQVGHELDQLIHERFTGQVVLECNEGTVLKYQVHATVRTGRIENGLVDLTEAAAPASVPKSEPTVSANGVPKSAGLLRGGRR